MADLLGHAEPRRSMRQRASAPSVAPAQASVILTEIPASWLLPLDEIRRDDLTFKVTRVEVSPDQVVIFAMPVPAAADHKVHRFSAAPDKRIHLCRRV